MALGEDLGLYFYALQLACALSIFSAKFSTSAKMPCSCRGIFSLDRQRPCISEESVYNIQVAGRKLMRIAILAAIALVTPVMASDDLVKTTTCQTNGQRIVTLDTYTRAGKINLTVKTVVRENDRKAYYRIQNVYRNGQVVMDINDMGDGLIISAKTQAECNVGTLFRTNSGLAEVTLMDANLTTLDHFTVTNGVLYPSPSTSIIKVNEIGADIRKLFDPANMQKTTPKEFAQEASKLKEKYQ
jgi:hypothetical protein